MFDRETVNAYKSIGCPEKMKDNILRMYEENKKPSTNRRLQALSAIAACFFVVFTVGMLYFGSNTALTITSHGEKVSKTPMAVAIEDVPYSSNTRSISMFRKEEPILSCVALHIDTDEPTEIMVSGGTLLLHDDELGNTLYAGEACVIDSPSLVYWSIDEFSQTDVWTLRLVTNGKTTKLSLKYDTNSEAWMLAYDND